MTEREQLKAEIKKELLAELAASGQLLKGGAKTNMFSERVDEMLTEAGYGISDVKRRCLVKQSIYGIVREALGIKSVSLLGTYNVFTPRALAIAESIFKIIKRNQAQWERGTYENTNE